MAHNEIYALMFGEDYADDSLTYHAEIGGHSWSRGPRATFGSIAECGEWAEEYGDTADWCRVTNADGQERATFRRGPEGWYRT